MISIRNLTYRIEGRPLFEEATAVAPEGHRIGFVGRNGAGKTTLFKLLRGEISPDDGDIRLPAGWRVGSVAQEAPADDRSLIDIVLAADLERAALLAEAETAEPLRRAEIETRLADMGAHAAPARAASILHGLGFDAEAQQRASKEFSGGWRMRVALAALLFSEPDLLLLDEPTNHLDLEGVVWLENYLARYPKTFIVISHDRQLLNRAVNAIWHLHDKKLTAYTGGYDDFDAQRRARLEQQQALKRKQDLQRAHLQSFVDRFRAKASKARQAQSRVKMLEKLRPIAVEQVGGVADFHFPTPEELPPPLLAVRGGAVGYDGKAVLRGLDFRIDQDDRIALLGANGQGKSTLSKLIAGRLPLMEGEATFARKLKVGYFAQHQVEELVLSETPYQHLLRRRPTELPAQLRGRLGGAGFGGELAETPVERLSGGQKARLLMFLAALEAPHLLILDEPTNHLDIESREALTFALNDYGGAVILVSHDPHLVETVADRLWLVGDGGVKPFEGDMEDYKRLLLSERGGAGGEAEKSESARVTARRSAAELRKALAPLRAEVAANETRVTKLEEMRDRIDERLADPTLYDSADGAKIAELQRKRAEILDGLERAEELWMEASSRLETLEKEG
ncbi:ABC-F family ATP-binding cassette domain-containing protein [Neomegalonema perideroedes]|uniref:ABC-F family ATP-binding cassette domain-containing protein n=1 Tax=Neomegalonema perideroedes TaxID=217219 RepID=UPI0003711C64|nr:ABC-F family ATP-binding cassette domain-containing protein [Neomegalonema perideroedes]